MNMQMPFFPNPQQIPINFEEEIFKLKNLFSDYETELFIYDKNQFIVKHFSELFVSNINLEFFNSLSNILDSISGDINIFLFDRDDNSVNDYMNATVFLDDAFFISDLKKIDFCPIVTFSCNEAETFILKKEYFYIIQNSIDQMMVQCFCNR